MVGFVPLFHCCISQSYMQDLATFLLTRGPYAWLGYGWQGCTEGPVHDAYGEWGAEMDEDYGEPVDVTCKETVPGVSGVFERKWSNANVVLDCKAWTGTITMNDGRIFSSDQYEQ